MGGGGGSTYGAVIAQLAECLTEKAGAILTRIEFPRAARDFSPTSQLPVQTLNVPAAPLCNRIHQRLFARQKSQTLAAIHIPLPFGHRKILHTLIGMGIALLLWLFCPTQVRRPEVPASDKEVLKQICLLLF